MSETEKLATYTKQQFLTAKAWAKHRDVLSALMDESRSYTVDEAKKLLDRFNKRKVGQ